MIRASHVRRTELDCRSSGDRRNRVDAYFVSFDCDPDEFEATRHEWICRFEVPRGTKFEMRNFKSKADAHAAKGWSL